MVYDGSGKGNIGVASGVRVPNHHYRCCYRWCHHNPREWAQILSFGKFRYRFILHSMSIDCPMTAFFFIFIFLFF